LVDQENSACFGTAIEKFSGLKLTQRKEMNIYKLAPIDAGAPAWKQCRYTDTVFVRAESEFRALAVLRNYFLNVGRRHRNEHSFPWGSSDYASCEKVFDSQFELQGPEELLHPDPRFFL